MGHISQRRFLFQFFNEKSKNPYSNISYQVNPPKVLAVGGGSSSFYTNIEI